MLYQRSLEIERRLDTVLDLIREGRHSTPTIAARLRVSVPTVSRDVAALRQRGHDIVAERGDNGWRYRLKDTDPFLRADSRRRFGDSRGPRGGRR